MIYPGRKHLHLLIVFLAAIGCMVGNGHAQGAEAHSARSGGRDSAGTAAFLLTISGQPLGVIPVTLSTIRATASGQLTTTLLQQGLTVVPQGKVLSFMREWRVRDGKSIPRGFLDLLADSLDVRLVLVADLVIQRGGLIMTARYLDTRSAVLLKVSVTEWEIDPLQDRDEARWLAGVREASRAIGNAPTEEPASDRELMLILDTEPVGCSPGVATVAGHTLFEYILEHANRGLIDPAVTTATLHAAGYSGRYLGADARALLRETFACRGLMIPRLISYAPARKTRAQIVDYDEFPDDGAAILTDFAMSLRLIDLTSGAIAAGKEVFLAVPATTGWFGVARNENLMQRMEIAASHLWPDINNALEEF